MESTEEGFYRVCNLGHLGVEHIGFWLVASRHHQLDLWASRATRILLTMPSWGLGGDIYP
jgi:hypothetical protein